MARFDKFRRSEACRITKRLFPGEKYYQLDQAKKDIVDTEVDKICEKPLDFCGKEITIGSEVAYIAGSRTCYFNKGIITDIHPRMGIQLEQTDGNKIRLGSPHKMIVIG